MASPTVGANPREKGEKSRSPQSNLDFPPSPTRKLGVIDPNLLDQLHDAILALDLEGNITGSNQAALEAFGYSSEELIGKNFSLLYPDEEKSSVCGAVVGSVLEKGRYHGEPRGRTKSGDDLRLYLSVSLLRHDNLPAAMLVVAVDISEQKLASNQNQSKPKNTGDLKRKTGENVREATVENRELIRRLVNGTEFLIASPIMHKFMGIVDQVARHPDIVLITGETGSGKELIARSVHDNSNRSGKPWVDINCAALPENLVESELFGYEKGAFSGADASKPGLFELADQGTLFLDEIGELDLKLQVKLLRVLDGSTYYRLGGHRKITVDVRIVAATNQDLELAVREGRFRRDLFHRLSQFQLRVPPLRERPEDIARLAEHFLSLRGDKLKFSPEALGALASYSWPGNVRELRNVVAKLAMAATGPEVSTDDLLAEISADNHKKKTEPNQPVTNLEGMEEQMIIKALESTRGHRGLAAEQLGISRRTLSRKLREYNITSDGDKARALGSMGVEQQKCFRATAHFAVTLKNSQGDETSVTAVNLSTGGLGVEGLSEPQGFTGLLQANFLLPETDASIEAKVRVVWTEGGGRAGIRFVVLDPAMYEQVHHWTARKMNEEGWELPLSRCP